MKKNESTPWGRISMLMILSSFVTHCRIVMGDLLDINLSCAKDFQSSMVIRRIN